MSTQYVEQTADLRPTSHRFTVGGRTVFAWCASDTLMSAVRPPGRLADVRSAIRNQQLGSEAR